MSDKESFSDKDVLMSNLSNEVPSYSTFDKAVVEKNENQNSFKDSKRAWDLHQVLITRTKIQVFFSLKSNYVVLVLLHYTQIAVRRCLAKTFFSKIKQN